MMRNNDSTLTSDSTEDPTATPWRPTAATPMPAGPPTIPDLSQPVDAKPAGDTSVPGGPTDLTGLPPLPQPQPVPEVAAETMTGTGTPTTGDVPPATPTDDLGMNATDPTTGDVPPATQTDDLGPLPTGGDVPPATPTADLPGDTSIPGGPTDLTGLPPIPAPTPQPEVADETGMTMNASDVPPGRPHDDAFTPTDMHGMAPGDFHRLLPSLPDLSAINPTDDLRSKVISSAPSDRTKAAQNATDQAVGTLGATDRQALVDRLIQQYLGQVAPNARLTGLQGRVDSVVDDLSKVDRFKLATDRFNTMAADTDPAFQASMRSAIDREVGLGGFTGRINTSLGDLSLQRDRQLRTERSNLLNNALEGSIQDAFGKESALSGLEGQLSAEDLNRFSTAAGYGTSNASADIGKLQGDLSNRMAIEGRSADEDATGRDSLRTERDYQVGQEGETYQRAVAQHQQEQQDRMMEFERMMQLLGVGESGNPAGEIGALSTGVNPGLDMAALVQLAQGAGAANAGHGTATTAPPGIDWGSIFRTLPTQNNQPTSGANV